MCFDDDTISGYYDILLVCKQKKGNWLKVILNEAAHETVWVKTGRFVKLIQWQHLPRLGAGMTVFMNRFPGNQIYPSPDESSAPIPYKGQDCFVILQVAGDWMQISNLNEEFCGTYEPPMLEKGWIRFKNEEALLVNLSYW
ncbi:MAG: hypothetical protein ACFB10_07685 [Salibacteraceae bacterium]